MSLPAGATILHCRSCQPGNPPGTPVLLAERDATVRPDPGLPDALVDRDTSGVPGDRLVDFEVHDTAFAWAANGLTAEASLPIVEFQDDGNTGYGNVTVHYRIPGGAPTTGTTGPDPDHLSWTEPVSSGADGGPGGGDRQPCGRRRHEGRPHRRHPARDGGRCPGRGHPGGRPCEDGRRAGRSGPVTRVPQVPTRTRWLEQGPPTPQAARSSSVISNLVRPPSCSAASKPVMNRRPTPAMREWCPGIHRRVPFSEASIHRAAPKIRRVQLPVGPRACPPGRRPGSAASRRRAGPGAA